MHYTTTTFESNKGAHRIITSGAKKTNMAFPKKHTPPGSINSFSNSAVEIITSADSYISDKLTRNSLPSESIRESQTEKPEDEVPPDELEEEKFCASENFTMIEETKDGTSGIRTVPESLIKSGGEFRKRKGSTPLLAGKSLSVIRLDTSLKQCATIKDTKSPDPFMVTHSETESKLNEIIGSTTNPNNPLLHLQRSGISSSAASKAHKHFIISLFESACFMNQMSEIDEDQVAVKQMMLPRPLGLSSNKTLVLDLDETLVHCVDEGQPAEVYLNIRMPDKTLLTAGINIRSGVSDFLERISKIYEVFVFTASHKCYADKILDYIERSHKWVHHRLYRQHCIEYDEDIYIKDLRILNRRLEDIIIVDNAPYSFASQIDNGYPIIPFYDYKEDTELKQLEEYLLAIAQAEDVRVVNREKFRLREVKETSISNYVQYYLLTSSDAELTGRSLELSPRISEEGRGESTPINPKLKKALHDLQRSFQCFRKVSSQYLYDRKL